MIKAKDAIDAARALIGTPYSELDCINLIKKVIRTAPGGVKTYTTAGTNTLWRSYDAAAKYKDLTWRQTGLTGAQAGMIAFKADREDYHHAGIVTGEGTVIHSSSTQGGRGVVETPLTAKENWTHIAAHRYIKTAENAAETEGNMARYKARVRLNDPEKTNNNLRVRNEPGPGGDVIGALRHGATVTVSVEYANGWAYIEHEGGSGYVSMEYLERIEEDEEEAAEEAETAEDGVQVVLVFTDSAGNTWIPVGDFKAELRAAQD